MKKSLIALAVAAALPVAAQADVSLSGDVSVEYTLGSKLNPVTEASFSASSSEVLSNGMTATASFNVLGDKGQGTVSLSGDFGTLTGGTAAATLSDVADTATKANDEDADLDGISYAGSIAGLSVHAMAGKFDEELNGTAGNLVDYVEYGASYDLNGLTISGDSTSENGVAATSLSASYSFGDLTVTATKDEDKDAVVKAAYSATMGDLAISVSAETGDTSPWDLTATYTLGDISITAEDDEGAGGAAISAKYASGALSVEVDSDSDVTVAYDLGNADLELAREDDATKVKYTVAF
jgi:hypothetical protein